MTLSVGIGAAPFRPEAVEFVRQAERLGVDSVWCPEFWAGDGFTPLAYLAACTSTIKLGSGIAQLGARTPAMLAMTAQSLHALSGGRCLLGIGTSGPQVMEGWHGVAFDKPVRRTRETIEIIRAVTAGERLARRWPAANPLLGPVPKVSPRQLDAMTDLFATWRSPSAPLVDHRARPRSR
jgi:alkanesulfonate monooxygenase SsuD/methylene tetrahydromethanopterin reductase-like flavin-dependent oxidoreductase (luciferase family)